MFEKEKLMEDSSYYTGSRPRGILGTTKWRSHQMNDLASELGRRKRAGWGADESIEGVMKKTKNTRLRAQLFKTTTFTEICVI
ncbi:hypothetical protein ANCCEY_09490 [Ancylostoma ceylanicum]|uniref:Uncharacterized protein n=1 Tax=Ancylostoma ceylanicum TaxID=53326 RepID=A0A0D6LUW6_9BILA|nr:hypothetical protein ANCCEY_09490 [Ancylostoma ceylanicum]